MSVIGAAQKNIKKKDCPQFVKYLIKEGYKYEEDPTKRRKMA